MAMPAWYKCLWPFKGLNRTSFEHASCYGHQHTHLQGKLEAVLITSKTTLGDKESMFDSELATGCLLASPPTQFRQTMSHSTAEVTVYSSHLSNWSWSVHVNAKPSLADTAQAEGDLSWWLWKNNGGKPGGGWSEVKKTKNHVFRFLRFIYVYMHLLACIYVHHLHAGGFGGKVRLSDSWELELLIAHVGM